MKVESRYSRVTVGELPKKLKREMLELLVRECDFEFLGVNKFETMKDFYNSKVCEVSHLGVEFIEY